MMTSSEISCINSTRLQRANRINNIEQSRLQGKLQLLEKERIHRIRIANNDIRLISLTLEYIQSSSGRSCEGRGSETPIIQKKDEQAPCFLYGERILSRKVKRFQRPQSAFDRTGDPFNSETSSVSSVPVRPQSSPAKRKPTLSWAFSNSGTTTSNTCSDGDSDTESPRHAWEDDTSDITKRILKLKEGKNEFKVALHERQIGHLRGQGEKGKSKVISLQETMEMDFALQSRDSTPVIGKRRGSALSKSAQLSEILNQRRPTLSSSTWGKHLAKNNALPISFDMRSQNIRKDKLKLNNKRQATIQNKLTVFKEKYPCRK